RARDVVPGLGETHLRLLHAGPPIAWERASGPLRGAVIGALLYEGLAGNEAEAVARVERGEVELSPCHHHAAVGPMAGVISPSMAVYVVE
ncbi:oxamate carbamoyltransferase subunit AllG family protein, partial [Escherichia coli]|uniref:oxamate carbamoyltransferase subunit AllG family protein n=1 Tax=Escherichia coli TaxID=562 RepID=UPI003F450C38